jgi:hypothetical protein
MKMKESLGFANEKLAHPHAPFFFVDNETGDSSSATLLVEEACNMTRNTPDYDPINFRNEDCINGASRKFCELSV